MQETNAELSESLEKAEAAEQKLQTLQFELDETKHALSTATANANQAENDFNDRDGKLYNCASEVA